MAALAGVSQSSVSRIWRAFGLQPHRVEHWKLSRDPLFVEKVIDIVGLYLDSPERALDRGEEFIVTRNGAAVGELRPLHRRRFVAADAALAAFAGAPPIDPDRFRDDVDAILDQDLTPRA